MKAFSSKKRKKIYLIFLQKLDVDCDKLLEYRTFLTVMVDFKMELTEEEFEGMAFMLKNKNQGMVNYE